MTAHFFSGAPSGYGFKCAHFWPWPITILLLGIQKKPVTTMFSSIPIPTHGFWKSHHFVVHGYLHVKCWFGELLFFHVRSFGGFISLLVCVHVVEHIHKLLANYLVRLIYTIGRVDLLLFWYPSQFVPIVGWMHVKLCCLFVPHEFTGIVYLPACGLVLLILP